MRVLTSAAAVAALLLADAATAMAMWPATWNPLSIGGGAYTDGAGDQNPAPIDLVGGSDGVGTFSAGFWAISEVDDQLSLRMRVETDGSSSNNVWQFLLDTDGDPSTVDWALSVRQRGSPAQQQVYFSSAVVGGSSFDAVDLDAAGAWTGPLADWSRWSAAADGSNFGGDADAFLDVAIPLSTFRSLTGLTSGDAFGVTLATSTSHTQVNRDLPLGLSGTDPVASSFAIANPEPGTGVLLGTGLILLTVASRPRSRLQRPGSAK